ncbi:MAG: WD40 repeat domain-containing protein, partial [Bacteroidia bacterium]|nr:WD40 repeat domain-containing protein [Bacteroidia bacterium]
SLEEGFAESLLEKLCPESADVELTYLQVFLDKIFRLAQSEKGDEKDQKLLSFTLPLLQKVGNVSDLLGSFLDEQISLLSNPDTALAVLKSFVSVRGTKRPMTSYEVKEYAQTLGKPIEESVLLEMLQTFIHLRILRDKDQNERYELRHDALATKIYEKITLVEKEIMEIRQFIDNAWNSWQKRKVLISATDLDYIAPYENRLYLPIELSGLLEKSKKEFQRIKTRRRNALIVGIISLFIILSSFSIWALRERKKAELLRQIAIEKKNESNSNLYASYSFNQLNNNATLSFRLAEKALEVEKENISAFKAVLNSYYSAPFYSIIAEFDNELNCLKISPKNNFIITIPFRSDNINIWDTKGNKLTDFISKDGSVINVYISPDENLMVTSSFNNSPGVFDFNGRLITKLSDHKNNIIPSVFSNDGKTIATGDIKTLKIWDLNGKLLKYLVRDVSYSYSIAFSPDGKYLVDGNFETIGIWDLSKEKEKTFFGHKKSVFSVTISSDNKYILSFGIYKDSTAILWNLKGEKVRTFNVANKITVTSFSPQTNNIAIGDQDGNLKIFNKNGELLNFINTNQSGIEQIQFTKDEKYIYTVSHNSRNILSWNLTSKIPDRIEGHKSKISSIEYSPDGKYIVSSSYDSTAILWTFDGKMIKVFKGHKDIVNSAQFSSDSRFIITSSNDHKAIVWDLKGKMVMNYKFDDYPVEFASFSPDNTKMVLISPANIFRIIDFKGNTISENRWKVDYSWNVVGGRWRPRKLLLDSLGNEMKYYTLHKSYINSAEFSRDGKYVITASDDSTAKIWDLKGNEILSLKGHNNKVIDASFSGDGEKIVTATFGNTLRIWNNKGQLIKVINGPRECLRYAIFSSDNKNILTQSLQDTCRVYDLKGNIIRKHKWDRVYISSAFFSPACKKILTASRDGSAKLWDTQTNKNIELGESYYCSFSPNGKNIATVSDWDHVTLWDCYGNKLQSFPAVSEQINSVKFSPNGKFILTSCGDNTARLWDLKGNEIHSFKGTGKNVIYASFSPDGKHIAIANDDNSIQIWLIDPYEIVRIVNENPDLTNVWKLNSDTKKKYNIDLYYFENILENAHLSLLNAKSENDTIQKIKCLVKAIENYDYVLKTANDSLPQNELIKVKNELSNVYKELTIISIYKREFKNAINYTQVGLTSNPNNGLLLVYKAIALLCDDQFDKTKEIILNLKGKPVETGNEDYDEVILNIVNNLENRGINHDNLLKLRLLIKN